MFQIYLYTYIYSCDSSARSDSFRMYISIRKYMYDCILFIYFCSVFQCDAEGWLYLYIYAYMCVYIYRHKDACNSTARSDALLELHRLYWAQIHTRRQRLHRCCDMCPYDWHVPFIRGLYDRVYWAILGYIFIPINGAIPCVCIGSKLRMCRQSVAISSSQFDRKNPPPPGGVFFLFVPRTKNRV